MRVLLAQINPIVGDIVGNRDKIVRSISDAKSQHIDLIVFPEMSLCGYPPEDLLLLPHFIDDLDRELKTIVDNTKGIAVIIGTVRRHSGLGEKILCNTAAIIANGILLGYQDKTLLPTYDVFDERRFFQPSSAIKLWSIAGKQIAVTICEDIWGHSALTYERDPVKEIAALHPDLVVNLSASPYSVGKFAKRLHVCQEVVKTVKAPLLFCNQVGGNDSLIFDGSSLSLDAEGCLVDMGKAFKEDFLVVDLSEKKKEKTYTLNPSEELFSALVLGLHDYFRKLGFKKACFGLSGGVDSALVACIAVEALGKENVLAVLMPSRYSSPGSVTDARQLADVLGIETQEIPIEGPFQSYLDLLDVKQGVTEENLQARIRGMILMAISNQSGHIVLSTGNKSELAMGYSTLYGDMCGGLAVISDVTKQQVYALAHWMNRDREVIPRSTIDKAPSAELRPDQKDTDSLPDYSVVDHVLQAYIEEHQSAEQISTRFGYSKKLVVDLIRRIHLNEYKRRQSPLGLRVSEKAFSIGRRFPVVQHYVG